MDSAFSHIKEPEDINADDEVEDTCDNKEDDLGAVEEQRSVILHLLSQLKLGMDLTRVSDRSAPGRPGLCTSSLRLTGDSPVGSFMAAILAQVKPRQEDGQPELLRRHLS